VQEQSEPREHQAQAANLKNVSLPLFDAGRQAQHLADDYRPIKTLHGRVSRQPVNVISELPARRVLNHECSM